MAGARFWTATDGDVTLAAAYGRYIHACASLERSIEMALSRLTPTTSAMATVLFAKNTSRRNVDILRALASLPEVELSDEDRAKLADLAGSVGGALDARNATIHNTIVEGDGGYMLVCHGRDNDSTYMEPISVSELDGRTASIAELSARLISVPFVEYDLSKWGREFRSYPVRTPGKDHKRRR